MIPHGSAIGVSMFRILWTPVHIAFALHILVWTWEEWNLPALPYHPFLTFFSLIPPLFIVILTIIYLLCAILIGIGWHTRFCQIALTGIAIPLFFHSASTYHNHYAFALFITFFLAILPTERFFSLDAKRQRTLLPLNKFHAWQRQEQSLLGQFLILLQTSFLYAFAALNKMNPDWFWRWSETLEFSQLSRDALFGPLVSLLFEYHLLWIPLVGAIGIMLFLAIGIFFARRHPWIAFGGIVFHMLLELSLPVIIFTPMMMAIWLLALFPAEHPFTRSIEETIFPPPAGEG